MAIAMVKSGLNGGVHEAMMTVCLAAVRGPRAVGRNCRVSRPLQVSIRNVAALAPSAGRDERSVAKMPLYRSLGRTKQSRC